MAATEQRNRVPSSAVTTSGSTNRSDLLRRIMSCYNAPLQRCSHPCRASLDGEVFGRRLVSIEEHVQRVLALGPPARLHDVELGVSVSRWRDVFRMLID